MATLHSKIELFLKDRDESLGREDASEEERAASSHKIIDMIDGKFRMNVEHSPLPVDGEPDMAEIGKSFMASFEILTMSEGPFKGYTPAEDPTEVVMDLHFALVEALEGRQDLADRLRGPAQDAAKRFIDHWFKNDGEKPRIGIPARPDYDDDLVLVKALKDAAEALSPKEGVTPLAGEAGAVERLTHERDCLAEAIAKAAIKAGILRQDAGGMSGPQLMMLADDLASLTPPKTETETDTITDATVADIMAGIAAPAETASERERLAEPEAVFRQIADYAENIAFSAGVGSSETAGVIVSFLVKRPELLADFMAGTLSAVDSGMLDHHNGVLSWHGMDGGIHSPDPSKARFPAARAALSTETGR